MPKAKAIKPHPCLASINTLLAKSGAELDLHISIMTGQEFMRVATRWIDGIKPKRGASLATLIPTYCPFCGKSLAT